MKMNACLKMMMWAMSLAPMLATADSVIIIGHRQMPKLDTQIIRKLYTGRATEVNGQPVVVVNAPPGSLVREHFMTSYLNQPDEKYEAYWTVRRFIGKGVPPRELDSPEAVIDFVQRTQGAVGYIDSAELKPGLNVLSRQ